MYARVGRCLGASCDQDLGVLVADVVGRHERQVVERRQPDHVVHDVELAARDDASDLLLDVADDDLGVLDARADRRAHVEAHLAGVDAGKEVEADDLDQEQRDDAEDQAAREEAPAPLDAHAQHPAVQMLQALEVAVAPGVEALRPARARARVRLLLPCARASAGGAARAWAPACATADTTPTSRTPPRSPAARTGSAPAPRASRPGRRRCRWSSWPPAPAPRPDARRRGSRP